LFPYGPGVNLINHSRDHPNVELMWSYHPMHHHTWLDLPYDQYATMDYPGGLILDVIALRDIQDGEELFMNYGDAWHNAWEQHVKTWKPDESAKSYVYPQDVDPTKPYKTVEEQLKDPYAKNLQTVCFTNNWSSSGTKNNTMKWTEPTTFDWPEGIAYCHILSRTQLSNDGYEYVVSLHYEVNTPPGTDTKYIDTNVPQSAISFVNLPYTSDLHLPNAFRFPIHLPSHLIPTQWTSSARTKKTMKS
jgi:hypothetical protein